MKIPRSGGLLGIWRAGDVNPLIEKVLVQTLEYHRFGCRRNADGGKSMECALELMR